jgi:hypothetical protein
MHKMENTNPEFLIGFLQEGLILEQEQNSTANVENEPAVELIDKEEDIVVADIIFSGTNSKNICICVYYDSEEWISIKDKRFLEQILSAVSLKLEEVALINVKKHFCKKYH